MIESTDLMVGTTCGECGRRARAYPRRIHTEMLVFLRALARLNGTAHTREIIPSAVKASTDASYLTLWGLVTKRRVGVYSLTARGRLFLAGRLRVPHTLYVFGGEIVHASDESVGVDEIKGYRREREREREREK